MTNTQIKKIQADVLREVKSQYVEYGLKSWEIRLIKDTISKTVAKMIDQNK